MSGEEEEPQPKKRKRKRLRPREEPEPAPPPPRRRLSSTVITLLGVGVIAIVALSIFFATRDTSGCDELLARPYNDCLHRATDPKSKQFCEDRHAKMVPWCRGATDAWRACFREQMESPTKSNSETCDPIMTEYWDATRTRDDGFR